MNTDRFNATEEALDASWCADVRAKLDREASALDSVTAARLAAARHRALAIAQERSQARWWPWLGGAVAASLLLAVVWVRAPEGPTLTTAKASSPAASVPAGTHPTASPLLIESDVAVIADLEFYDWLEEQDALL